jgi:polar amino acid transport system substrate-binding protein
MRNTGEPQIPRLARCMKRSLFLALITGLLLVASPVLAQKLRVAYSDIEVAPYQLGSGPTVPNAPGAMVELINQVGKELGLEVVYERAPQLRGFRRLKDGEVDAAFMYSYVPDRQQFGRYPMKDGKPDEAARMVSQSYVLYRLKGSPFHWDGRTVTGLGDGVIGFNSTFSIGALLGLWGLKAEDAKTTEQNFQKLTKGRIQAYAMQEQAAESYLAANPMPEVEKIVTPLETKAYYLMLSHQFVTQDPQRAEKIWARLGKLRQEKMPELLRKYTTLQQ